MEIQEVLMQLTSEEIQMVLKKAQAVLKEHEEKEKQRQQ